MTTPIAFASTVLYFEKKGVIVISVKVRMSRITSAYLSIISVYEGELDGVWLGFMSHLCARGEMER